MIYPNSLETAVNIWGGILIKKHNCIYKDKIQRYIFNLLIKIYLSGLETEHCDLTTTLTVDNYQQAQTSTACPSFIKINNSTAFGEPLTFPIWKTWEPVHPDTGKHWYLYYEPFFWAYPRWLAVHEDQIGFALVKGLE